MSGRYVYVIDNHGYLDWGATSADLNAIELWKGHENTISDPASVLYFNHIEDSQYDVTAQGTGIHQIIDYYVKLYEIKSEPDTYMLYASKSGMTKYLCDGERSETQDKGVLGDSGEGKWRYWHLEKSKPRATTISASPRASKEPTDGMNRFMQRSPTLSHRPA